MSQGDVVLVWVVGILALTLACVVGMVTLAWWSVRVAQAMASRPTHVVCDCDEGPADPDPPYVDPDGVDRHWALTAREGD